MSTTIAIGGATRLYIDTTSGTLPCALGDTGRAGRWLWNAEQGFDLPDLSRSLLRSLNLMPLLAAVILACETGAGMGLRNGMSLRKRVRRSRHCASPPLRSRS